METIRLLKTGVVDIAEVYGGYVAGELPLIEIVELPGVFLDAETAKKAHQAWKPHLAKLLDEKPMPSCSPVPCTRSRSSSARSLSASCKTLRT